MGTILNYIVKFNLISDWFLYSCFNLKFKLSHNTELVEFNDASTGWAEAVKLCILPSQVIVYFFVLFPCFNMFTKTN